MMNGTKKKIKKEKIPETKWKHYTKPLGYILSGPTEETYSSKCLTKSEGAKINDLMMQLKNLEKQEQIKPKFSSVDGKK